MKILLFIEAWLNFFIFGEQEGIMDDESIRKLGRQLCVLIYGKSIVETWEMNGFKW